MKIVKCRDDDSPVAPAARNEIAEEPLVEVRVVENLEVRLGIAIVAAVRVFTGVGALALVRPAAWSNWNLQEIGHQNVV
jgi:hypothetical protein